MSTNFYRIPTEAEMEARRYQFLRTMIDIPLTPALIERGFEGADYEYETPWSLFIKDTCVHLGKRSCGWTFLWNFNDNKYYSNKEELFAFIRSGRVVDEYGDEENPDEFIAMALDWVCDDQSRNRDSRFDYMLDGLRVSRNTDFF